MDLVHKEIEHYAIEHTTEESELINELVSAASQQLDHIDMLSGKMVGQFLAMMIKISNASRVLEVGTFAGYSALKMAEALPEDGEIITCEYNERYEKLARSFFDKSDHGHKVVLKMGDAVKTIPTLRGTFDFSFLDADKVNYPKYYDLIMPILKPGGILVVDNVFWDGSVLNPNDEKSKAIDRLNKKIAADDRVEQVMITVRDGLSLVRKLRN
ncbi:MAG: class I SAM-dependent methyltransferase [Balneolaceae bacterium]|nr:class I SAM-dependent methyltransferase [Balneolaceae bacterium]